MIKVFLTDFSLPYTFRLIRQHDGNMMMMVMIKEELFWGCMRWQTGGRVEEKSSFNYKFPLDMERWILGFDSTAQFRTNYSLVFVPNNPWGFFTHPTWMLMAHKEKIEHNTHSNISTELKLNWKLFPRTWSSIFSQKKILLPTSAVVIVCCYSRVYASSASFTSEDTWYSREKKYLSPINKKTTFFLLPSIFNYWSKWDKFGREAALEPAKSRRTAKKWLYSVLLLIELFRFQEFLRFSPIFVWVSLNGTGTLCSRLKENGRRTKVR